MFRYFKIAIALSASSFAGLGIATEVQPVSFRNEVATILLENCVPCHGPKKAEGGYRIDTFDELQKPGDSGAMPVVSESAASSELLRRIASKDESERMPPEADPLAKLQIELIQRWIAEGAKFDGDKGNVSLNMVMPPRVYLDPPATYPAPVPITAMAFSPDGSQLLVGGYHEVTIWNTTDGSLTRRIKNVGQRVHTIVFLADQKTIAIGCGEPGKNGEVRLVDFESGNLKGVVGRTSDVVFDVAVRPIVPASDAAKPVAPTNEIAIAAADGIIRIVNTDTMVETRAIANHADWVTAVAWSDDGVRLASASRDKSAKVFEANSGELLVSYQGHGAAVRGIVFLPDGKYLFSTGLDKKMHRWETVGGKKVTEVSVGGEAFKIVRGGPWVFIPSSDKQLRSVTWSDNKVAQTMSGYQDWVLSTAYHAGTSFVAGGASNGEIRLWNATDGKLVRHWIAKP